MMHLSAQHFNELVHLCPLTLLGPQHNTDGEELKRHYVFVRFEFMKTYENWKRCRQNDPSFVEFHLHSGIPVEVGSSG